MKKILLALLVLLFAVPAFSQTLHNLQQATVAWDAVAIPTGTTGSMRYQVYTKNDLVATTGAKVGGEITATQLLIGSFTPYVAYYAGVEAVFYPTGQTTPQKSGISWSNDASVCLNGVTFGFSFSPTLDKVKNMRFN